MTNPSDATKGMSGGAENLSERAKDAVEAAVSSASTVRDAASSAAYDVKRAAGPAYEAARRQAGELGARAQDLAEDTYRRGREAATTIGRQVQSDPLVAALAAFAIGYGLSYFLHGRGR
jgi:hypothetical protein